MFSILQREMLSPESFLWEVRAPDVARAAEPGQFVIIRLHEKGERIPLTVADFDRARGTITLVVKVVGKSTEEMATYPKGGNFSDLIGPLGCPTHIEKLGHVVLVGGGIGVAPIYPILRGFQACGTRTTTILGFRTISQAFWIDRFKALTDRLIIITEDGSTPVKGTVLDALRGSLLNGATIDEVLAIGPVGMMQAVAEQTRPLNIKTIASMNPIMVDGIGMCGACRVTVDGKVLFACVDGPDMDAHKVDFESFKIRQRRFHQQEQAAWQRYRQECELQKRGRGR